MAKRSLRIALAQLRCELLYKERNLSRIIGSIKEAKQKKASAESSVENLERVLGNLESDIEKAKEDW